MNKRIGAMMLVCVSVCLAGWPVYDWTAAINATKQIAELVKMYEKIRDQYEHMYYQAKYVYGRSRYGIRHSPWKLLDFSTRSKVTDVWRDTVNVSGRAREAWERATTDEDLSALIILDAMAEGKHKLDIGQIELQDGTAIGALDTIGNVRANGLMSDHTLGLLEDIALSDDPNLNTEAAQLNTANAIALVQIKEQRSANQIALAQTEMSLLRLKAEREAAARAVVSESEFRTAGARAIQDTTSNGSAVIRGWRMP